MTMLFSRLFSHAIPMLLSMSVLVFTLASVSTSSAGAAENQPNIVLFIADDVSVNDLGCYGNDAARTPHIDALAGDGLRFTNAFLTASSCSPSRASIITGRYPHNTGKAAELHLPISAHLPWFPELLREAGYFTALVGKNHMSRSEPEEGGSQEQPKAFDVIDGGRAPGNQGGHARWVQTLRERPQDKPFFCWFAAYDAHRAWDSDDDWNAEKYGPKHSPDDVIVPPFLADERRTRQDLASYYNEVTRFDYFVGQVVEALREEGTLDNTLLIVMADNGRPFPRAKTRLHNSGMQTPLVMHWPKGISANGEKSTSLVSAIDLAPTILRVAGVEPPATMQGVSLEPIFEERSATVRDYAFSEHNWHDYEAFGRSVRTKDYLLIYNGRRIQPWQGPADSVRSPSHQQLRARQADDKLTAAQADVFRAPRPEWELYHSADDPHQLHNLAGEEQHADKQRQLTEVLHTWMEQTADSMPENISQDAFDRETGDRLPTEDYRGTTPGEDRKADRVNAPGPR